MTEEIVNPDEDILNMLTPEELLELQNYAKGGLAGGLAAPSPSEIHNVHKFLHDVFVSKDTTKTGNLNETELGNLDLPLRTLKDLHAFGNIIADDDPVAKLFGEYSLARGEIWTSTSLSKDAKLLELSVTTTRQLGDITRRPRKKNRGWFKKKEEAEPQQ